MQDPLTCQSCENNNDPSCPSCTAPIGRRQVHRLEDKARALLESALPTGSKPPERMPVDMMGWFAGKTPEAKALAAAEGMCDTLPQGETTARLALLGDDGRIAALAERTEPETRSGIALVFAPNHTGGLTLMLGVEA